MYDVKVFTKSSAGASTLVESSTRNSWIQAANLRSILHIQYPPHAFLITIEER